MSEILLYNTMTRRKERFEPLRDGEVRIYSCGPTVHDYAHIGNFRAFVFVDLLRRHLELRGYEVRHLMNITDVGHMTTDADEGEDKIGKSAQTATRRWRHRSGIEGAMRSEPADRLSDCR